MLLKELFFNSKENEMTVREQNHQLKEVDNLRPLKVVTYHYVR